MRKKYQDLAIDVDFAKNNHSQSKRGTPRSLQMHGLPPAENKRVLVWDVPDLSIQWPLDTDPQPILSTKDSVGKPGGDLGECLVARDLSIACCTGSNAVAQHLLSCNVLEGNCRERNGRRFGVFNRRLVCRKGKRQVAA